MITNTDRLATYTGNGVTTNFPFNFLIPDEDEVEVTILTISTGVESAPLDPLSEFTINGAGNPNGGSIDYPQVGLPLTSDQKINIKRVVPMTQEHDINNQGPFSPEELEDALDRIVMMIQQNAEEISRAFQIPSGSDLDPADIVSTVEQAAADAVAAAAVVASTGLTTRVRVATTANITIATALNVGDTIDGVVLADGDIVLVKDQSAPAENGIYTAGAVPARSSGYTTFNNIAGQIISVQEGTVSANQMFLNTDNIGGTINVTAINYIRPFDVGTTDNVVPRSDGTGRNKLQPSALSIGDTGVATLASTDAGAVVGPELLLDRASASPAASDVMGRLAFRGRDSGANAADYADIYGQIIDPADGSEDGMMVLRALLAGASTPYLFFGSSAGIIDLPLGKLRFPAVQSADAGANVLDDYEEGTWTPAFSATGCTFNYAFQLGRYIKIGKWVIAYAMVQLATSGNTLAGNALSITGLPFAAAASGVSDQVCRSVSWFQSTTSYVDVSALLVPSSTVLAMKGLTAAGTNNVGAVNANALLHATNGSQILLTFMYEAAS